MKVQITAVFVVLAVALSLVALPATASAATGGCYGSGCNGRNPAGLCDDGITVASKAVTDGLLELRYSPSCKANWGRYTPWWNTAWGYYSSGVQIHARVTAWNPGGPSYGTAHHNDSISPYGSSWSQMVDGTKTACTGVEIVHYHADWYQSQGWNWGPCV